MNRGQEHLLDIVQPMVPLIFPTMDGLRDRCIPANPEISGIGVRTAIYAQNIFSFGPAIVALSMEQKVTFKELHAQRETTIDYRSFIRIRDSRFRHRTNCYIHSD
jgi:hypothetical protein